MKNRALFVLLIFAGTLAVHSACSSGWLPHCLHDAAEAHHHEPCPEDTCQADYPAPTQGDGKSTLPLNTNFLASRAELTGCVVTSCPAPAPPPVVLRASRPAGQFPLLI